MNSTIVASALAAGLAGFAGQVMAQAYGDVARVVSATPIYDRVAVPRRECHVERITTNESRPGPVADPTVTAGPVTREVQRCNQIADATDRLMGYDVRYEYNGHEFRMRMPYDPGKEMPVNVDVRPPMPDARALGPRTPYYR